MSAPQRSESRHIARAQRGVLLLLVCAILAACANTGQPGTPTAAPLVGEPSAVGLPTPANTFDVDVWVDNATPSREQRVTVSGSLIKNGVRLGGLMMRANWPDPTRERGTATCYVQVIYGAGVCAIEAHTHPPGIFVPVTITFDYRGGTYIGHTGFTPQ
jgi:hypothetical protein